MLKTSTPKPAQTSTKPQNHQAPKERTLDFIRQFARNYVAPCASRTLPGIVLN